MAERCEDRADLVVGSTEGVQIAAHELGGEGPVLLFAHATGFHGRVWEPLADLLSHRYRCVGVDLRGHGDSPLPPGVDVGWTGMAQDVLAVIDALGGPVRAVGHSMGGAALVLAELERPGSIERAYLYEPIIYPAELPDHNRRRDFMIEAARRRREVFADRDEVFDRYSSKPPLNQLDTRALRAYVDHGFEDLPDGTVRIKCRAETEASVFAHSVNGAYERLADLHIPVLIASGHIEAEAASRFVPLIVDALPHGQMHVDQDLGHFGPLEAPELVAARIAEFMSEGDPGS